MRLRPYRPFGNQEEANQTKETQETKQAMASSRQSQRNSPQRKPLEPCANATAENNREANVQTKA